MLGCSTSTFSEAKALAEEFDCSPGEILSFQKKAQPSLTLRRSAFVLQNTKLKGCSWQDYLQAEKLVQLHHCTIEESLQAMRTTPDASRLKERLLVVLAANRLQAEEALATEVQALQQTSSSLDNVPREELEALVKFKHLYEHHFLPSDSMKIFSGEIAKISRNILMTQGMILLHFNKKNQGDIKHEGGAFGKVSFGIDLNSNREVAIKAIPQNHYLYPFRVEQHLKEYQIQSQFKNCDYIVSSLGFLTAISRKGWMKSYLILQKMEEDILDRIDDGGLATTAEKNKTAFRLIGGVKALHAQGVIHRDIKLENLLIDKNGNSRLSDFGFAHSSTYPAPSNEIFGTYTIFSPRMCEIGIRENQLPPPSLKDDIWALGITLYRLYVLQEPYPELEDHRKSHTELSYVYECQKKGQYEFPKNFPAKLKTAILSILAFDETQRPNIGEIENTMIKALS